MSFRETFKRWPENFPIPFVLDGATGTSLQARGMPKGACTETWVDQHPEMIRDVQTEFIESGSDSVNSPNFGGSRYSLTRHGVPAGDVFDLNRRLIGYSRALADERNAGDRSARPVFVTGNTAPSGKFLEPYGDTPFEDLYDAFREQAEAMEPFCDLWYAETEISLAETRASVLAYKSVSDKPVFATLTLGGGGRTMSGDDPLCCLLTLASIGVTAFGFNCSDGPEGIYEALKPLVPYAAGLGVALMAKPNAGKPHENPDGTRTFSMEPDAYIPWMRKIMDLGVYVVGGCCGTSGRYIRPIKELTKEYDPEKLDIEPIDSSRIACTNSVTAEVPEGAEESAVPVSEIEDFDDFADNLEEEYAVLRLDSEDDADTLEENLISLTMPLCLTGDPAAIAKFARIYCGKPVIVL